jgi:hypothetical protein
VNSRGGWLGRDCTAACGGGPASRYSSVLTVMAAWAMTAATAAGLDT